MEGAGADGGFAQLGPPNPGLDIYLLCYLVDQNISYLKSGDDSTSNLTQSKHPLAAA